MSHDVIRPGHAESKDAFGLEVERLHLVVKPLPSLAFLGSGQKFGLETGDQIRGKLGAVVANPLDGIVGVLDVVDPDVERSVGLADQRVVFDLAVSALRLEIIFQSFLFPASVDGVFVVHPKLDIPGIDLPDLRGAEDGRERLGGLPGLDKGTGGGLRVQTDELALPDGRVEHEGFKGGVRDDGHFKPLSCSSNSALQSRGQKPIPFRHIEDTERESGSQPDSFLLYGRVRERVQVRVPLANETEAGKGNKQKGLPYLESPPCRMKVSAVTHALTHFTRM